MQLPILGICSVAYPGHMHYWAYAHVSIFIYALGNCRRPVKAVQFIIVSVAVVNCDRCMLVPCLFLYYAHKTMAFNCILS